MNDQLLAAQRMCAAGLSVIPIGDNKIPATRLLPLKRNPKTDQEKHSWEEFQRRQPTAHELAEWFAKTKTVGIGLVAGRYYGRSATGSRPELFCLDIEREDLYQKFSKMVEMQRPGLMGRLVLVNTPKPGVHCWGLVDGKAGGNVKLAHEPDEAEILVNPATKEPVVNPETGEPWPAPRVVAETRCNGGYALVPGCVPNNHPKGGDNYKFRTPRTFADLPLLSQEEFDFLLDFLRSLNSYSPPPRPKKARPKPASAADDDEMPGDWFERTAEWAEVLTPAGWKVAHESGDVTYWERPGQERVGWSATTGYCKSSKGEDLLYPFSTNAYPFEARKAYGKFNAYALLMHNNDHSAAAKALAARRQAETGQAPRRPIRSFQAGPGGPGDPPSDPPAVAAAPEPWEDPLPFDPVAAADPFPLDVLPKDLARMIEKVMLAMNVPADYLAVPMLSIAGGLIGATRRITIKPGYSERASLYCCVVGSPGSTKTSAQNAISDVVFTETSRRLDLGENELHIANATVEAIAPVLQRIPRGVVLIADELTEWLASLNQYKGGKGNDRQFFLSAWSGQMGIVHRKNQEDGPIHVPFPFIGIIGGIQPDVVGEFHRGANDGFIDRILFSWPVELPDVKENWASFTDRDGAEWREVAEKLWAYEFHNADGRDVPVYLHLSNPAKPVWEAWTERIANEVNAPDFPARLKGVWKKIKGYAARLALILHLLRDASHEDVDEATVDAESMRRGVKLAGYFLSHARKVYGHLEQVQLADAKHVWGWITRQKRPAATEGGGAVFTKREIHRGLRKTFSLDEVDTIVGYLYRLGYVRPVPDDPTKPFASRAWETHPTGLTPQNG